jgi:hypothetical protein
MRLGGLLLALLLSLVLVSCVVGGKPLKDASEATNEHLASELDSALSLNGFAGSRFAERVGRRVQERSNQRHKFNAKVMERIEEFSQPVSALRAKASKKNNKDT